MARCFFIIIMQAIKKHEVNMTTAPIFKGLLKIAIPIMVMNVLQSIFNFIDQTMLGHFVGDVGVGSVGACSTLITLITGLLIGIATGSNVIVARHIAKGDSERVEKAIGTSIIFSIVGGIVLMLIGLVFARTFLTWMNTPANRMEGAVIYFRLYFLGCPILLLYNFCASILRSAGDSKRPMYFLTLGGIVKILVNFLFLKFTNFTVQGVAIATIVSWAIAGGLCFFVLLKGKGTVKFKWSRFRFYGEELKAILHIGIPTGIQSATFAFANVMIASTVNKFGDHATDGVSIANTFDGIIYQIAYAPSLAVMPFISQNVSVNNAKRVKETLYKGCLITIMFAVIAGSLSAIFSEQLSSLMSQTPEVIAYSKQKMIIISSTYVLCGLQDVFAASLRGLGKPVIPTVSSLIFLFVLRFVWVYAFFPLCPNLTFLYLSWPIGWVLNIVALAPAFIYFFKKLKANK
ncbi:MAG: MATE family efflux transporter [Clostridia bacterium]|nr:MATE family efflux transporter [Clostridia bacterium]